MQPQQPTLHDLEQYLEISVSSLDEALMQQPELYRQVADAHALAVSRRDEAKEYLEQVDAQLYADIRQQAEEEGRKVTEKTIDSEVHLSEQHQQAHNDWVQKKLEADQWAGLKDSFQQRSHMLREMVSLFVSGFYSDPAVKESEGGKHHQASQQHYEAKREALAEARKQKEA